MICIVRQPPRLSGFITMQAAMELIDAERRRLIKHFGRQHENGRLIGAAWSYRTALGPRSCPPQVWPWHANAWRPSTRFQNLIKAGALFLAEAERLQSIGGDVRQIQEARGLVLEVARELQKHRDAAAVVRARRTRHSGRRKYLARPKSKGARHATFRKKEDPRPVRPRPGASTRLARQSSKPRSAKPAADKFGKQKGGAHA